MRWVGVIVLFAAACGGRPASTPIAVADTDIDPPPGAARQAARRAPDAPLPRAERIASRSSPPPASTPRYRGRRIDVDLREADLHNVFRFLAEVGAVNIVVADDVSGRVTLRLRAVPWDQALHAIAASEQLVIHRDGDIYLIQRRR